MKQKSKEIDKSFKGILIDLRVATKNKFYMKEAKMPPFSFGIYSEIISGNIICNEIEKNRNS